MKKDVFDDLWDEDSQEDMIEEDWYGGRGDAEYSDRNTTAGRRGDGRRSAYDNNAGGRENGSGSGSGKAGGRKNRSSRALLFILSGVLAAAVIFAVVFFLIPFHYETLWAKLIYNISDADTRFEIAMEKGDRAYENGNYKKALYFYEEKALTQKPRSMDAWIALLRTHAADEETDTDTMYENLLADLTAIGELTASPETSQAAKIVAAVNAYMDLWGEELTVQIASASYQDPVSLITAFFERYDTFTEACAQKVDCAGDNAKWYVAFYDVLAALDGYESDAAQLLAEGLIKYPENEDLLSRANTSAETLYAQVYEEIDTALAQGDFEEAYVLAESIEDVVSDEDYETLLQSIAYIEERTEFLQSLLTMMESGDYDGAAKAVQSDAEDGISTCYLQDGVYTLSVSEGEALLYDSNGIYLGEIEDDTRVGEGLQLKYYSDGSYQLLEGTWDGNAQGTCTYIWKTSDGIEAEVTGNFTDGYEDGTMTITWKQNGVTWTGTYTASLGTYTALDETEDGAYIYVIAYADDGSSAWWATTKLTGNGCFIN